MYFHKEHVNKILLIRILEMSSLPSHLLSGHVSPDMVFTDYNLSDPTCLVGLPPSTLM